MVSEYVVGIHLGDRRGSVTVEAEDALAAALKVKQQNPSASITYVRRANRRGDVRHPHGETMSKSRAQTARNVKKTTR